MRYLGPKPIYFISKSEFLGSVRKEIVALCVKSV